MNSSSPDKCAKCGKTRSKVASITQWISYGDKCSCDSQTEESVANFISQNEIELQRSESCPRCGGSLSKQSGSLTQWVFRSAPCKCGAGTAANSPSIIDTVDDAVFFDDEKAIEVDPTCFPLDRYTPIELIGSGTQGDVYRARDRLLRRLVCIKILKTAKLSPDVMVRFQREAQAGGKLAHPNITMVLDFGLTEQGEPFLVMEFCSGTPLSEFVRERGGLPLELTLDIFEQICEGMQHAHQNRVVHRDLKTSNVLVTDIDGEEPTIKIIDFGISGLLDTVDDTGNVTQQGLLIGTPAYMSPEQVRQRPLDERSDLYSIGCMLFETLTGRQLFEGRTVLAVMNMQLDKEPPTLAEVVPDLEYPEELEAVLQRLLEKDPDDRFQSMEEFQSALQELHSEPENSQVETAHPNKRVVDLSRFVPYAFALVSLIVLGITCSIILSEGPKEAMPIVTRKKDMYESVNWFNNKWSFASGDFHGEDNARKLLVNCKGTFGLKLHDPNFSDSDVPVLVQLNAQSLDLSGTKITDAGLKTLAQCKNMQCLIINRNKGITDAGMETIKGLSNLKVLSVQATSVTDTGVQSIAQMPGLASIDLSELPMVGRKSIESLSHSPHIFALRISGTGVRGEDLKLLKDFKYLTGVAVANLNLIDADLDALKSLDLLSIDVGYNSRLTFKGIISLNPGSLWTFRYDGCTLNDRELLALEQTRDNQPFSVKALEMSRNWHSETMPEDVDMEVYTVWYNPMIANKQFVTDLYTMLGRKPKAI